MENRNSSSEQETIIFIFSFCFALLSLLLLPIIHPLDILLNLLYLPFTLLHEIGHIFLVNWVLPGCEIDLEFNFLVQIGYTGRIKIEQLPVSITSIILLISGSITVFFCIILIMILTRKKTGSSWLWLKNFLLFGLLLDLPNLLPILPSMTGACTDGYSICIILKIMGYNTLPSFLVSLILLAIASTFVFSAFYYLGRSTYHLISKIVYLVYFAEKKFNIPVPRLLVR